MDTFYPEKDRFELAMTFNNLLASPKFQNWLHGEALDIDALLYTADGKARHSIFYIAHLSPQERMFLVTLLLESVLAWVRRQAGTRSLRAILYFDEVYGFLPPVAQPPSKRPLMALLKQSRAVGLGCVLATQNPADIDYKALSNTGTWFIGRLQTERDKARVVGGLKGAIAERGGDSGRVNYDEIIGRLRPRTFLMHNVHEEAPVVFQTRWVMSYLHGPLTRSQIQALMADRRDQASPAMAAAMAAATEESVPRPSLTAQTEPVTKSRTPPAGFAANRPVLDPDITQLFLPLTMGHASQASYDPSRADQAQLIYEPGIMGIARVRFFDRKYNISERRERILLAAEPDQFGSVDWNGAQTLSIPLSSLEKEPAQTTGGRDPYFAPVPEEANSAAELKRLGRDFADWLYHNSQLTLLSHPGLEVLQRPGETEQEFKGRLHQAARERRDDAADKLRDTYAARIEKLEDRLRRQRRELDQDKSEYGARKREALIATGEMLFTILSRRRLYRTASWSASRRRLAQRAKMEIEEGREELEDLETEINELQAELEREMASITPRWVDILRALTRHTLHPRRADVEVSMVGLAWVPSWVIT